MFIRKLNLLVAAGLVIGVYPAHAQHHKYDDWDENYTVQALLGTVKFEDLEFDVEETGQTKKADLSTIPQLGGAWGTLPKGDRFQYGLEASFLIGFRTKDVEYLVISSGLYAKVSTSLWMFDLAGGPYVNLFLDKNKKVRLYGAVGPLLMYADYDADKEYDDDTPDDDTLDEDTGESALGVGVYARAGIEFRTYERGTLGMGVCGTYSDIDFSNVGGTTEIKGIAAFVTFTAGF